jgi:hypothetical protein
MGAILLGNLALAMDEPDVIEKAQLLNRLTKEQTSLLPDSIRSIELNNQIAGLRKELNIFADASVPASGISETKELDNIIEQMPVEKPAAGSSLTAEQFPTFDQIPQMTKAQLLTFQEHLLARGEINDFIKSQITERLEELATIERVNKDLTSPEVIADRALSPKRVHFQGVASDSDGSGIARPNKPNDTPADVPLAPEELGLGLAAKPAASQQKPEDSSSDSDMPELEKIPVIELNKGAAERNAATTSGQKHSVPGLNRADVPALFNKDDFEDALLPEEDFNGSNGAAAAPEVKVGKDAAPTPVADSADPLARAASPTEPIETPADRVATKSPPLLAYKILKQSQVHLLLLIPQAMRHWRLNSLRKVKPPAVRILQNYLLFWAMAVREILCKELASPVKAQRLPVLA